MRYRQDLSSISFLTSSCILHRHLSDKGNIDPSFRSIHSTVNFGWFEQLPRENAMWIWVSFKFRFCIDFLVPKTYEKFILYQVLILPHQFSKFLIDFYLYFSTEYLFQYLPFNVKRYFFAISDTVGQRYTNQINFWISFTIIQSN